MRFLLPLLALCTCCGGSVDERAHCDPDAALDQFKIAHGEVGAVGEWVVGADCTVVEVTGRTPQSAPSAATRMSAGSPR